MAKFGGRSSRNVEDRRGQTSARSGGAAAALPLFLIRFLFSRMGRRLLMPIIIVGVAATLIFGPQRVIGFVVALLGSSGVGPVASGPPISSEESDEFAAYASGVLATTEEVWGEVFRAEGRTYQEPKMVLYTGGTSTGCGFGQAAMGPFYCPNPEQGGRQPALYLDLSFFKELDNRMGAGGDFAQAYVIAHEVGHHVQKVAGVLDWAQQAKSGASTTESNQVQVRVELMADCLAGVWAKRADQLSGVEIDRGDLDEALRAAEAVGDDTLQRRSSGRVVPDSFTHGTSEQRARWFMNGYNSGDWNACETREVDYNRL